MEPYRREQERQEKNSTVTGIVLTVAVHLCIIAVGFACGLKYIYPPPEEESILLDFSEDVPAPVIREMSGQEPRAVEPDPDREVELVQRSEGQVTGTQANEAAEANRRALFHSADNRAQKDTLAPQTAAEVTDELKAGHAAGTAEYGKEIGEPKARLKGRSPVNGYLPKPAYPVQKAGTVVVNIKVDNYGNVSGQPSINMENTTVTDRELWQAAINAAKKTKFNRTIDAPPLQEGTITYIFRLN